MKIKIKAVSLIKKTKKRAGIIKKILFVLMFSSYKTLIIEINPRMSGSVSVSIKAGQPIFDNLIAIARNKKITKKGNFKNTLIFPYTKLVKA